MPEPCASGNARCPRCGGAFHCGAADPAPCPCATLTLSAARLADLRERYRGCLCLRCLTGLARADDASQGANDPDVAEPSWRVR